VYIFVNKAAYGDEPSVLQTPNDWISCGAIAAAWCANTGPKIKLFPIPLKEPERAESGL